MTVWQILLACFLLLFGILGIFKVGSSEAVFILNLLAIATGIFLFARK